MCSELIGKPYEFGTNGDTVDCIALVIQALNLMGVDNPGVKSDWYEMNARQIIGELANYTEKIPEPSYDGDIVIIAGSPPAFELHGSGILYINRAAMKVDWRPACKLPILRSYRTKRSDPHLGCSEEEYRKLMRFALLKARTRPAEYDHIPDIVNDPVSIIVSIVVGVALQAAAALLRDDPAPVQQENENQRVGQDQLSDQIGPSRFNQTSSFDGFASLVEYGKAVPIPFGKMGEGADGKKTGGLVLAGPVWSRAYSAGNYQRVKLLYTLGQWTPAAPKKRGVWLGTTSLSALATLTSLCTGSLRKARTESRRRIF